MVAPSSAVFSKGGPAHLLPLLDGHLVALRRSRQKMLPTPPQLTQQPTDMVAVVVYTEGVGDELRHLPSCPDVTAEPMRFGAPRQKRR